MSPEEPFEPLPKEPRTLSRREFVKVLGVAAVGSGLLTTALRGYILTPSQRHEAAEAVADKLGKLPRRQLGTRMGPMRVAPIAICQDWPQELYAPALAAGLNFVHKAGYWKQIPEDFKRIPREAYFTDITVDSTPRFPDDEERAYNQVNESLQRNGLRYYDIFKAHFGWHSVKDLKEKRGTYRAFQRLKREGKVRYYGCSQHPYLSYPEIIGGMIEDGTIDIIQPFYSYASSKEDTEIFEKAQKAGIALMPMKVMNGGADAMRKNPARMKELKSQGMVGRACYRHVLTLKASNGQPIFPACVSAIGNMDQFEENLGAVSMKVAAADGFEWA